MNDTTTRPATVASGALAVIYVLSGITTSWLRHALHERLAVPPDVDRALFESAIVDAIVAVLWVCAAVACARRRWSPVVVAAVAITCVVLGRAILNATLWSSEVDFLELGKVAARAALVAVVLARRPRAAARDRDGVARADHAL